MRFICPSCRFDERDESDVVPIAVRCPGCAATWAPAGDTWRRVSRPTAPRRDGADAHAAVAETFMTIWGTRTVRA